MCLYITPDYMTLLSRPGDNRNSGVAMLLHNSVIFVDVDLETTLNKILGMFNSKNNVERNKAKVAKVQHDSSAGGRCSLLVHPFL